MGLKERWEVALAANPREVSAKRIGWGQAVGIMGALLAVLWVVQIANAFDHQHLDRFGVAPRTAHGLIGIVTMPFLHSGWTHLLANSGPFLIIGWVVLLSGPKLFAAVTGACIVLGGALAWLIGPSHTVIVGCSALVLSWLGYLIARAFFSRRIAWIFVAILVGVLFIGMFGSLFPQMSGPGGTQVSWQAHVAGFVAGLLVGWLLHPRKAKQAALRFRTPAR